MLLIRDVRHTSNGCIIRIARIETRLLTHVVLGLSLWVPSLLNRPDVIRRVAVGQLPVFLEKIRMIIVLMGDRARSWIPELELLRVLIVAVAMQSHKLFSSVPPINSRLMDLTDYLLHCKKT